MIDRLGRKTIMIASILAYSVSPVAAAFSNELAEAITKLVSKYHDESAPGGRAHRLVVVAHPLPQKSHPKFESNKSHSKEPS